VIPRSFSVFRHVKNNNLGMDSRLPTSPHRMAASPHEQAGRLYHPIGDLSLDSINLREPVLLLKREAKLFPLSGHFLFEVRILLLKLFLCLILVYRGKIELGILCICKVGGQKFEKIREKVCLEDWVLDIGRGSLLSPRVG